MPHPQLCPRSSEHRGHSLALLFSATSLGAQGAHTTLVQAVGAAGAPETRAQVSPARAVSPPCACWRSCVPSLGSREAHSGRKQFQGHRWYKQNEAEKLNKNQSDTA